MVECHGKLSRFKQNHFNLFSMFSPFHNNKAWFVDYMPISHPIFFFFFKLEIFFVIFNFRHYTDSRKKLLRETLF